MTITDYIKKEIQNIKERPPKERWEYFWDYYKWHTVIIVLVLALLIQGIVGAVNRKDVVFAGYLLNCKVNVQDDEFLQGFYDYAGIDSGKEAALYSDMILTNGYSKNEISTFQRIMAGISVQEADFLVGQDQSFRLCAYSTGRMLMDLRSFLDADQLAKFSDRLYYIDGALLDELDDSMGNKVDYTQLAYPDPRKPETMEDPVPVGIDISDRKDFQSAYYYDDTPLYLGVIINAPHTELMELFLDYLWS